MRVVVDGDPQGLVFRHEGGARVRVSALNTADDGQEVVAIRGQGATPCGSCSGGDDRDPAALVRWRAQEPLERRACPRGLAAREVDVVDDHQRRRCLPRRRGVGGDARSGRRRRRRGAGPLVRPRQRDPFEVGDLLRLALLQEHEVVLGEANDGAVLVVDDDGVHRDQFDGRGKCRRGRLGP